MSKILPIGSFLETDERGYFLNPCSADLIVPPWSGVVEEICDACRCHLGEGLRSVYVRGSVPRGTAIVGVSDVDAFAVTAESRWRLNTAWTQQVRGALDQKHPFQTGVELQVVTTAELLDANNANSIGFFVRTLSTCVWGEDFAPKFPPFKPGRYLTFGVRAVEGNIKKFQMAVSRCPDEAQTMKLCQWLMKNFVRTGFLLVAERECTYTRDLYPSYQAFRIHYPEQAQSMRAALEWSIDPTCDLAALADFVDTFGSWLVTAVAREYPE